jgi:hypothetical protein
MPATADLIARKSDRRRDGCLGKPDIPADRKTRRVSCARAAPPIRVTVNGTGPALVASVSLVSNGQASLCRSSASSTAVPITG